MEEKKTTKENININTLFDLKDLKNFANVDSKLEKTKKSNNKKIRVDKDSVDILQEKRLQSCFELTERIKQKLRFFSHNHNYVQYLQDYQKNFESQDTQQHSNLENKGKMKIKVIETQNIYTNCHMKHPFVKIHFVDQRTGKYIQKTDQNQKNFLHNNNTFNQDKEFALQKNFDVVSTRNCNIQEQKVNQGIWNEELIINSKGLQFDNNTLLLFEILDYDFDYIYDKFKQSKLNQHNQYKLYWGYLKIKGIKNINKGLLDIQLFDYKFNYSKLKDKNLLKDIPEVYLDFLWPIKKTLNACLKINIDFEEYTEIELIEKNPKNIFQQEEGVENIKTDKYIDVKNIQQHNEEDTEQKKHLEFLNSILYTENKMTDIPQKLFRKLDTEYYGSLCIKFSNQGQKLAYSLTFKNNLSIIRIYDIEKDKLQGDLYYHNDIIHDIQWHKSDQYLMSCSSDCSCKIFMIPQNQFNCTENKNFVQTIVNTEDYCYSSQFFYPEADSQNLFFVLSNKKGFIYFYKYEIYQNKQLELLQLNLQEEDKNEFANCLEINDDKLYVGHSNGKLSIFTIEYVFDKIKLLRVQSLRVSNSMINQIKYIQIENCLLVLSRDNYIRMLNLKNHKIPNVYSNGNFQNSNIKFCISGDEQIILSGSENGKTLFWDLYSADYIDTNLNHSIKGIIAQVTWNKKYNLIALGGFGSQYPVCLYY